MAANKLCMTLNGPPLMSIFSPVTVLPHMCIWQVSCLRLEAMPEKARLESGSPMLSLNSLTTRKLGLSRSIGLYLNCAIDIVMLGKAIVTSCASRAWDVLRNCGSSP